MSSVLSRREEVALLTMELERRACKKSLTYLMEEFLGYRNLAPFHREIEKSLRKAEETSRRALFLLPRGHLKSTEITVSYVLQRILRDPNVRVLITNASLDNSKAFLREIKSHFEKNDTFRDLFGDWCSTDEKWSETQIIVKERKSYHKEPTVQVTSADKSVVSQHYDIIIVDDVVNRESISTKEQREKSIKYYKDLLDLLEPNGMLVIVGTRWHYDDLYGWLMAQDRGQLVTMKRKVLDDSGNPIFPQKFSLEYVTQLRLEKGSFEFNAQYNNEPVSDEEADFKREHFLFMNSWDMPAGGRTYITVDPSVGATERSDYTGIVINRVVNGTWHVVKAYKVRLNPTQLVDELFYLQRTWKPECIGIEDIMYTQALEYMVERRMRETGEWFRLDKLKHRGRKKENRIRALIPMFERGNIKMSEQTLDLQDELSRFPLAEYDDVSDALAYQLDVVRPDVEHFSAVPASKEEQFITPPMQAY